MKNKANMDKPEFEQVKKNAAIIVRCLRDNKISPSVDFLCAFP